MWKRIVLWLMILVSVAFNYILWQDNQFLELETRKAKAGIVDYCLE